MRTPGNDGEQMPEKRWGKAPGDDGNQMPENGGDNAPGDGGSRMLGKRQEPDAGNTTESGMRRAEMRAGPDCRAKDR